MFMYLSRYFTAISGYSLHTLYEILSVYEYFSMTIMLVNHEPFSLLSHVL